MCSNKKYAIRILLFIALFQLWNVRAQEKTEKSGFAVHMGLGPLFAGTGFMAEYQFIVSEKIKFDPFIAIGSQAPFTEFPGIWWGYTSGLNLELGKVFFDQETALNWLVGLNYGSQGVGSDQSFSYHSDSSNLHINKHLLTGCSFITGYRLISRRGFTFQINIGVSYAHNPIGNRENYYFKPTGGFGIGYKFSIHTVRVAKE